MLENVFQAVLVMSGMGALLALVLLVCKPILQKKFSAGWCYYIWLLVLAVMIVPVKANFAEEHLHLQEISDWAEEKLHLEELRQVGEELLPAAAQTDENGHRLVSPRLQERRIREIAFERRLSLLSQIWLTGAILTLMLRLAGYVLFLWNIHKNTENYEMPRIARYTRRKIRVRRGAGVHSPMLFGVIRPVLLMPVCELNEEQLHNVLAHEMTHLRRNDMLLKWLMMVIKSLHWFNPFVYLIDSRLEQECEISCDIAVTKSMSNEQKKSYADTILAFLMGQKKREFSLSMGMAGTRGL